MLDRSGRTQDAGLSPAFERGQLKVLAYQRLRAAILQCELPPGAFVTETRLASWLGLGKAPVRNALASLVSTGLIEAHARRGYRVAAISDRDIADIFDLRRRLEPSLGDVTLSRSDLERLQRLDDIIAATGASSDPATRWTAHQADRESLHLLATASGNALLTRRLGEIWDLCDRAVAYVESTSGQTLKFAPRGPLIDALAAGDQEASTDLIAQRVAALANHVRTGLTRMAVADSAGPTFTALVQAQGPAQGLDQGGPTPPRPADSTNSRETFSEENGRQS